MQAAVRTKLIRIGNSQGVRIPRFLLDQLALGEDIELVVMEGQLILRPLRRTRQGWDEAFRQMAERGDDRLLDESVTSLTQWDGDEWEWK